MADAIYMYQFFQQKTHIEQAVDKTSPRFSRQRCPNTGWISQKKAGEKGCLALWSKRGCECYTKSGLLGWQVASLRSDISVRRLALTGESIFTDSHQALVLPGDTQEVSTFALHEFLEKVLQKQVLHFCVVYLTESLEPLTPTSMLFVSKHDTQDLYEAPYLPFEYRIPTQDAVTQRLAEKAKISATITQKLNVSYDYDFTSQEFIATHYFQGVLDDKVKESQDSKFKLCTLKKAYEKLPPSQKFALESYCSK